MMYKVWEWHELEVIGCVEAGNLLRERPKTLKPIYALTASAKRKNARFIVPARLLEEGVEPFEEISADEFKRRAGEGLAHVLQHASFAARPHYVLWLNKDHEIEYGLKKEVEKELGKLLDKALQQAWNCLVDRRLEEARNMVNFQDDLAGSFPGGIEDTIFMRAVIEKDAGDEDLAELLINELGSKQAQGIRTTSSNKMKSAWEPSDLASATQVLNWARLSLGGEIGDYKTEIRELSSTGSSSFRGMRDEHFFNRFLEGHNERLEKIQERRVTLSQGGSVIAVER